MEKNYYRQDNIGTAKYTINSYDGVSTHKDGSPFYDIHTFKNKDSMNKFIAFLKAQGYKER